MIWILLGCAAAVLLILVWWHRVLLTLWCILIMLWISNKVLYRVLPRRWHRRLVGGPVFNIMIVQLRYACHELESGIGSHCFEENDK